MTISLDLSYTKINSGCGTSLQGYIKTTYADLVHLLGKPSYRGEGEKITCEWIIKFNNGPLVTIYDYKTGKTPKDLYEWHVGGNSKNALFYINELVKKNDVYAIVS